MADEQLLELSGGEHDLTQPGKVVWPLTDHLGTVRDLAVYDAPTHTTAVANHLVYDSYGKLELQTNAAVQCLIGFTGRPFDRLTGLQNNWNRWYDAQVGQWASKDPVGFTSCNGNTVCYCHNSPVMCVDSTGLWWSWTRFSGFLKVIGGIVEAAAGAALGVATSWTGIGGLVGFGVSLHGLDVLAAGLWQLGSGEETDTNTSNLLQWFGVSRGVANWIDTGISIFGSFGASAWTQSLSRIATAFAPGNPNAPIVGGGAQLENLSPVEQARIQSFANRYRTETTVVGSRAGGTAGPVSDFDYIIGGNSKIRANARIQLPRGAAGGEIGPRGETGIDIFNGNKVPLDPRKPHIIFKPNPNQGG